jgi:hypothetical protein
LLASLKTITNTETCTESCHRILPGLTISVIGWFVISVITSLGQGKSLPKSTCHGRFPIFQNNFNHILVTEQAYSNRRVSECRNKLFEEGYWKEF